MPLLSLPPELLFHIIGYIDSGYDNTFRLRPPLDIVKVASTCQTLRYVAVNFIYSSVRVTPKRLHGLLASNKRAAASIRKLTIDETFGLGGVPGSPLLEIEALKSCTKLRELNLSYRSYPLNTTEKTHPFNKSPKSRRYNWPKLWVLLEAPKSLFTELSKRLPSALKGLTINSLNPANLLGSERTPYLLVAENEPGPKLESVREFSLAIRYRYQPQRAEANIVGEHLARAMPEVQILQLCTSSECIYGMLSTYAELGSRLTQITLTGWDVRQPSNTRPHRPYRLCEVVPRFSHSLTRLVIDEMYSSGLSVCHELFGATDEWPSLDYFSARCRTGCEGINLSLFRAAMVEFAQTRPQVGLSMEVGGRRNRLKARLVSWNLETMPENGNFIASLEEFKELDPAYQRLLQGPQY